MPTFCLVFALGYQTLRQVWQRRWALGLVALSVGVHFAGVFGHGAYQAWEERHDLPDQGLSLFALRDTQIGAHARGLAGKFMRIPAGKR